MENHPSARTDLSPDGPEVSLKGSLWRVFSDFNGNLWKSMDISDCNSPMSVPCRSHCGFLCWSHVDQRLRWMMALTPTDQPFLDDFAKKWLGLKPRLESLVSLTHANQLVIQLESRRRRTKGSVVGEEWCQNAAPLRWYTKNVFAQSKMILSRAWLHDTVSCAAWNDARKGVYLKPLFKTPCSNCYWGWSIPIMLDYRDISLMESVPLMWGPVTASPVGIEPMTILGGAPLYNWYPIHNGENSTFDPGWPPNTPYMIVLKHGELR